MKLRLGMWNRLAIVATVLAAAIAPLVIQSNMRSEKYEFGGKMGKWCRDTAERDMQRGGGEAASMLVYSAALEKCFQQERKDYDTKYIDGMWSTILGGTLIACLVAYLLIAAMVFIARWIWRGRAVQ